MAFNLSAFVNEYFIFPMRYPQSYAPYNIYNTAAFAIIALLSALVLHRILTRRLRIPIDERFYFAVFPYVLFGGFFRVAEDAGILPREIIIGGFSLFPFITPGIYIVSFLIIVAFFEATMLLSKKADFIGNFKKAGWALAIFSALSIAFSVWKFPNLSIGLVVVTLACASALLFRKLDKVYFKNSSKNSELATVFAQSIDGAATFCGLAFAGYFEQHVVGNLIIDSFGPLSFFLVKVAFVMAAVWIARREFSGTQKDIEVRTYFLLLITVFGLGPGVRDIFRIVLGV